MKELSDESRRVWFNDVKPEVKSIIDYIFFRCDTSRINSFANLRTIINLVFWRCVILIFFIFILFVAWRFL